MSSSYSTREENMTEQELTILRLNLKIEVHLFLLRGLYSALANISPDASKAFRDRFAALRQEHGKIAIQGLAPGYSDLVAAEYQEALEDALSNIEAGFHS
jgi:hypothetical protein